MSASTHCKPEFTVKKRMVVNIAARVIYPPTNAVKSAFNLAVPDDMLLDVPSDIGLPGWLRIRDLSLV